MNKCWNWIRDDTGGRVLRLEGPIDNENFWGDEITPTDFRSELEAEDGDVTVWINSPGGNVFAAAEIYTMLLEYKGADAEVLTEGTSAAENEIIVHAFRAGDESAVVDTAKFVIYDGINERAPEETGITLLKSRAVRAS
jgi:ATP-dependent protease ClpP protease subunit